MRDDRQKNLSHLSVGVKLVIIKKTTDRPVRVILLRLTVTGCILGIDRLVFVPRRKGRKIITGANMKNFGLTNTQLVSEIKF